MRQHASWYSHRLEQHTQLARWGHWGVPLVLFPTAAGDAYECERNGLIDCLAPYLADGRLKVYSVDSVAGRVWLEPHTSTAHRVWMQEQFDGYVYQEVVPAIYADCGTDRIPILTAGASIGAFNAVASLCRHPDAFHRALGMSGTFDLKPWMRGEWFDMFYYCSPLDFLPGLSSGWQLSVLRERFVWLAFGQGRWEDPQESWRLADILGGKGIPNRVDAWGYEFDHDWPTWRIMLPIYVQQMLVSVNA